MITLNRKEQEKSRVIQMVIAKEITQKEAALKLGVTDRQIRRLIARVKEDGETGLIHKNRGVIKDKKITKEKKEEIIDIYLNEYSDYNFTHFYEEICNLFEVSQATVYNILMESEIISPMAQRKTTKKYNEKMKEAIAKKDATKEQIQLYEERKEEEKQKHIRRSNIHLSFGEETQMDATPYLWFNNTETHLHLIVDKATKIVLYGWFDVQETTRTYFILLMKTILIYGVPRCIKTDKRSCFSINNFQDEDNNSKVTQFKRICNELDIILKCSSDPIFKSNVERENRTFKGRLKAELRHRNITTMEEANKYLTEIFIPNINQKFAYDIEPNKNVMKNNIYSKEQLNLIISERENRKLDNASSIKYKGNYYVPINDLTGEVCTKPRKTSVTLVIAYDNTLWCYIDNELYSLLEVELPKKAKFEKTEDKRKYNGGHKPSLDHPWKNGK